MYQFTTLFWRSIERNWRDVDYLFGKLMLNIINGLFIGFTYFKTNDSIQGTQNAAFVRVYLLLLISIADSHNYPGRIHGYRVCHTHRLASSDHFH